MNCDLDSAAVALRDRARRCATDVVTPQAQHIDATGVLPDAVREAARPTLPAGAIGDLVTVAAVVEELAVASAAVALATAGSALGAVVAGPATQWPGLRGADIDGVRAAHGDDPRWATAVTAALIGLGRAAVEQSRTALRSAREAGTHNDTAQAPLADAATMVDAARLLLWDAARAGRASESAAAAQGMARLQALEALVLAVSAAEHATGVEASRPGAPLERLSRDAATLARVCGEAGAAQRAVAALVLPA